MELMFFLQNLLNFHPSLDVFWRNFGQIDMLDNSQTFLLSLDDTHTDLLFNERGNDTNGENLNSWNNDNELKTDYFIFFLSIKSSVFLTLLANQGQLFFMDTSLILRNIQKYWFSLSLENKMCIKLHNII